MAIPGNMLSVTTEQVDPNASGWRALTNCTISLGSGGRVGTGVLAVKSTAAGEMRAVAAARIPVTPGETYFTFADASAAAQAERIGIRWLRWNGTELSVTWGLTTQPASSSWHRVSVAGAAPAGATHAQVLLSSSPTGAGVYHYWENVYLGWPIRYTGNLLSFDAESMEVGTGAWAPGANTTLDRMALMATWAADNYYGSGHMLMVTAVAAGAAEAVTVERPAVTPGQEYTAFAYLRPPTTGSSVWIEIRFYSSTGTQVGAQRAVMAPSSVSLQRQYVHATAPAGAASASVAVGITGASAGQFVVTEGVVLKAAIPPVAGSVIPMADADFEQGVGAWAVTSGVATLARSTPWGANYSSGAYSGIVASSTATSSTVTSSARYPVYGGQSWRWRVHAKVVAGSWSWTRQIRWYDEAGAEVATTLSPAETLLTPGWWIYSLDITAPDGAVQAGLEMTWTATAASSQVAIDRMSLYPTLPLTEVSADAASASVRLVLREMTAGRLMTVHRVVGTEATLVRGQDGLLDAVAVDTDQMVIEDHEAPLGIEVYYRIVFTDSDGLTIRDRRITPSATVPHEDPNYAWLKDPSRPRANLKVLVKRAPAWQDGIEQAVYRVRGRPDPVVLSGVRQTGEGDLVVWTQTDEEREALRWLLSTGNTLLWQSAPGMGEPDVYVTVGSAARPRVSDFAPEPWREWTLPLTEVAMPTGGLAGSALWTVQDVLVENSTGWDVLNRYATVFDLAVNLRKG